MHEIRNDSKPSLDENPLLFWEVSAGVSFYIVTELTYTDKQKKKPFLWIGLRSDLFFVVCIIFFSVAKFPQLVQILVKPSAIYTVGYRFPVESEGSDREDDSILTAVAMGHAAWFFSVREDWQMICLSQLGSRVTWLIVVNSG